ncbi:GNAT family N-acetyltransferase [Pricia sp.]|uniref:GNAT family N-acetyltransferase n=1 Tax=Pricia sp. TaxID=2268138 RepID=UPI003593C419
MAVSEKSKFYKVGLLWKRIRHGLFLFTLRNSLTRIGLDIAPYYWYKEVRNGSDAPEIRDSFKDYKLCYIGLDEIGIMNNIMGLTTKELERNLSRGQLCIGLRRENEIAALLFVDLNDIVFKERLFKIRDKEGYLLNVYTFQAYRGKNLATYLRYHCFELLEKQGIDELYSIVSYFNTSSLKVNKKLNAQKLKLYLHIGLFKRYRWNFLLRNFSGIDTDCE